MGLKMSTYHFCSCWPVPMKPLLELSCCVHMKILLVIIKFLSPKLFKFALVPYGKSKTVSYPKKE